MRPLRICLENFGTHRSTDIDCTLFNSVLVVGKNRKNGRESNAVGKTTIFRAIEYVLFGKASVNLERIIRHGCDRCCVIFEFESMSQIYRIVRSRTRKTNKSELRLYSKSEENWVDITQKTPSDTEIELNKIIKISHGVFRSSVLFAQADLFGLASATPTDRKAMLKEPLQISIYNKYEKSAKEKVSQTLKQVEKIKTQIEMLGDPSSDIQTHSVSLISEFAKLDELNQSVQIVQNHINHSKSLLAELEKLNFVDEKELRIKLNSIQKNNEQIAKNVLAAKNILSENKKNHTKISQELVNLKENLVKLESQKNEISIKSYRPNDQIKIDVETTLSQEIETKALITQLQIDQIKLQKPISNSDICDHCLQLITPEHRNTCAKNKNLELQKKSKLLGETNESLKFIRAKRIKFEIESNESNQYKITLTDLINKIAFTASEIDKNIRLIESISNTIALYERDLVSQIEIQTKLKKEESILIKQIDESNNQENIEIQVKKIVVEIQELENKNNLIINKIATHNTSIGVLQEKITKRHEDKSALDNLLLDLKSKNAEYSMRLKVHQAFSTSGIPTMIINTVLDDLQITANFWLQKVRPEIEIMFSVSKTRGDGQQEDTWDIIYRINSIEHDYEQLSGAQKVSVTLALKRALRDVIQHRIGVDIGLLVLDEVDSQYDDASLDSFINMVKEWQKKITVFVITHNKYLKNKFSHAILVEGDEVNGACGHLTDSWD